MLKSRKKILLSSIAMLLVALVALGSATFAWYFTNTQVTAGTTSTKASSADGLVIREAVGDPWAKSISWTETATEKSPMTMDYPAKGGSYDNKTGLSAAQSDAVDHYAYATGGTALADWAAIKGAAYYKKFYVAKASDSGTESVKLTITGSQVSGTYINLLVFVDHNLVGAVTSDSAASSTTGMKSDKTAGGSLTFDTLGAQISTAFTVQNNGGGQDLSLENGSTVEVIAFPDGQNPKCTTLTANTGTFSVGYTFDKAA